MMSEQRRQSDWRVVMEVRTFAEAVAKQSGLPGPSGGPADALRHLAGAAELARRLGERKARIILEGNEWQNWVRGYAPGVGAERRAAGALHRAMDRHNNRRGVEIGGNTASAAASIERSTREIERAFDFGPGANGAATWLPINHWSSTIEGPSNWPPRSWPDFASDPVTSPYLNRHGGEDRRSRGGGPVAVHPHQRDGYPVRGHTRAAPAP